jgi:hypothetical protein
VTRGCVTHHFACDCREERHARLVAHLTGLIADLAPVLDHDGIWTSTQIAELRRKTANALPDEQCPEWLRSFRDPPLVHS